MELNWREGALAEGLRCYAGELFFEAHEHWESVWLRAPEPERTFLQALIQVAAAFHHLRRHNMAGARQLLAAASGKLAGYPSEFQAVAVAELDEQIRERLLRLEQPETAAGLEAPSIPVRQRAS